MSEEAVRRSSRYNKGIPATRYSPYPMVVQNSPKDRHPPNGGNEGYEEAEPTPTNSAAASASTQNAGPAPINSAAASASTQNAGPAPINNFEASASTQNAGPAPINSVAASASTQNAGPASFNSATASASTENSGPATTNSAATSASTQGGGPAATNRASASTTITNGSGLFTSKNKAASHISQRESQAAMGAMSEMCRQFMEMQRELMGAFRQMTDELRNNPRQASYKETIPSHAPIIADPLVNNIQNTGLGEPRQEMVREWPQTVEAQLPAAYTYATMQPSSSYTACDRAATVHIGNGTQANQAYTHSATSNPYRPAACQSAQNSMMREPVFGHNGDTGAAASSIPTQYAYSSSQPGVPRAKLWDLPKFAGDSLSWPAFESEFITTTEEFGYTDARNIIRLRKALVGPARSTVEYLLPFPDSVAEIMSALKQNYGRPSQIINKRVLEVRAMPRIAAGNYQALVDMANSVRNLTGSMRYANSSSRLCDATLLTELVSKLPPELQMQWAAFKELLIKEATITEFSDFLNQLSKRANVLQDSLLGTNSGNTHRLAHAPMPQKIVHKKHAFVAAKSEQFNCIMCSNKCRHVAECPVFKAMRVDERWSKIKEQRLCFRCLKKGHMYNQCLSKGRCGVAGCSKGHHMMLHDTQPSSAKENTANKAYSAEARLADSGVLFQIVPVIIRLGQSSKTTYAFIDHGASHSMIEWNFANSLGMQGQESVLEMQWLANVSTSLPTKQVDFEIQGQDNSCRPHRMTKVYTVQNLNLPRQSADYNGVKYKNAKPVLIIGLDHAHLTTPITKPIININKPIVSITKLGRVIYGNTEGKKKPDLERAFVALSVKRRLAHMEQLMKTYYEEDGFGAMPETRSLPSRENERALKLMEDNVKRKEDCYEVGLLWARDQQKFPETIEGARKRLNITLAKMKRDNDYANEYKKVIDGYLQKGYARKLNEEEAASRTEKTFYLPHFAVINPNKSSLRVVFDAAAEIQGSSLNKELLAGPDLNQPLLKILLRFRQAKVAICGDIREMFLQVAVKPDDQESQRFLWPGHTGKIESYVMTRMLFGAKCSPTLAQYVKNVNARRHENCCPRAVASIVSRHYVDDYVDCFDTEDEAEKVVKRVIAIQLEGGFQLRKFMSNSKVLLQKLGETEVQHNMIQLGKDDVERVLGMHWDHKNDEFRFVVKFHRVDKAILQQQRKPTKREVLSLIMSVFDPFGLLGNYILSGKCLMQELWKAGLQWDEILPDKSYTKWRAWIRDLPQIEKVKVPRCYAHNILSNDKVELHVFADASQDAMAAVAYICVNHDKIKKSRFVMSKTRCAPLKYLSIPRMELQAAVLAVRLKNIIEQSHDIKFANVYYWSDSTTVISWIKSDSRTYKQYVANRIGEILDHSREDQWRWLPTDMNVADEGTRISYGGYNPGGRWLNGPEFINNDQSQWPKQPTSFQDQSGGCEKKKTEIALTARVQNGPEINEYRQPVSVINFERFSSLKRCVGMLIRILKWAKKGRHEETSVRTTVEEVAQAMIIIHKHAQKIHFAEELRELQSGRPITKNNVLKQLNPIVDEQGVMRLAGRIDRAPFMSAAAKRPIILPKESVVTDLIVMDYHHKARHLNKATIIAEIRQRYWIPSIRAVVNKCQANCNACKKFRAKPSQPQMGLLPPDRLTPYVRPFTYTGMDYFGPVAVAVARRQEKRWVALFTCLGTRAVHLELAANLSSDACLLCIKNFINRRGVPIQIRSDNGTNFLGLPKELQGVDDYMDTGALDQKLVGLGIKWVFNCPGNPSAGGAWERLVQSVKRVLGQILKENAPRTETLISALIEAENIVNSRPLTHLPVEAEEAEPLTPNHFLINSTNSTQTPGDTVNIGANMRKQWRIAQTLKNAFWKRWIREYLPELTRRSKWCEPVGPLQQGDLVIICDDAVPRSAWKRGRIEQLYEGADGIFRTAEIRTANGTLRRPVSKLAKLDIRK